MTGRGKQTSVRFVLAVLALLGVASLPALLGSGVVARVSELHHLAEAESPYLPASHGLLLYVLAPVVVTGAFGLFLAPGLLVALGAGCARTVGRWLTFAFAISLILWMIVGTAWKLVSGGPTSTRLVTAGWPLVTVVGGAWTLLRLRTGPRVERPTCEARTWRSLLCAVGIWISGTILLLPKIFWENFNLDGIEAFEFGRSLIRHVLPHWDVGQGVFGFYPNFVLFAYPNHWFTTLFGPVEAAARLPFLLYLALLPSALLLLVESDGEERLGWKEEAALALGVVLFAVVQAFDTGYEPFFADVAEMAATDTLAILCFLMAAWTLWEGRRGWFAVFGVLTYLATPGALLLLGALAAATLIVRRARWREDLPAVGGVIVLCAGIGLAHDLVYTPVALDGVESQFSSVNLVKRLFPPTFTELHRFNVLLFASGIVPALSLLFVGPGDRRGLALAGITLVYFGAVYVQRWTSVHQFFPVMVLPLAVYWRRYLRSPSPIRRWLLPAAAIGAAVSLLLSLPRHFEVDTATRHLGEATVFRVGDYGESYREAVRASRVLDALVPTEYRLQYPDQPWGTDPKAWLYYALRPKGSDVEVNYRVQPAGAPAPRGWYVAREERGVSVYVRDPAKWREDRTPDVPRVVVSPLYDPVLRHTYAFFRSYSTEDPGWEPPELRGPVGEASRP